jgi:hypothetical protein
MAPRNTGIEPAEYVASVGISHHLEMLTARLQFLTQADVNVEADRWLRHQGVDVAAAVKLAGPIIESNICTLPGALFSFAGNRPDFFQAFVHVVHDRDAETEVDLIAWTRDRPQRVFRYFAFADCLASDQVENPTTYFAGAGLLLYESPLNWLRCGCRGAVVFDFANFHRRLERLKPEVRHCRIVGNTVAHARDLAKRLKPLPARVEIYVRASQVTQ